MKLLLLSHRWSFKHKACGQKKSPFLVQLIQASSTLWLSLTLCPSEKLEQPQPAVCSALLHCPWEESQLIRWESQEERKHSNAFKNRTGNRNAQVQIQAPFGQLSYSFEMFKMFSDFHRAELGVETWPENHNYNYTSHHDP